MPPGGSFASHRLVASVKLGFRDGVRVFGL
jgi:hypothetical protein